jgi:hypothetical protein
VTLCARRCPASCGPRRPALSAGPSAAPGEGQAARSQGRPCVVFPAWRWPADSCWPGPHPARHLSALLRHKRLCPLCPHARPRLAPAPSCSHTRGRALRQRPPHGALGAAPTVTVSGQARRSWRYRAGLQLALRRPWRSRAASPARSRAAVWGPGPAWPWRAGTRLTARRPARRWQPDRQAPPYARWPPGASPSGLPRRTGAIQPRSWSKPGGGPAGPA